MTNFGKQWETETEKFNEATGVIERERTKLRVSFDTLLTQLNKMFNCACFYHLLQKHVAPVSEKDLNNPHIAFYCRQNPGWQKVQ